MGDSKITVIHLLSAVAVLAVIATQSFALIRSVKSTQLVEISSQKLCLQIIKKWEVYCRTTFKVK